MDEAAKLFDRVYEEEVVKALPLALDFWRQLLKRFKHARESRLEVFEAYSIGLE